MLGPASGPFWAYRARLVVMLDLCRTYIWQLRGFCGLFENGETRNSKSKNVPKLKLNYCNCFRTHAQQKRLGTFGLGGPQLHQSLHNLPVSSPGRCSRSSMTGPGIFGTGDWTQMGKKNSGFGVWQPALTQYPKVEYRVVPFIFFTDIWAAKNGQDSQWQLSLYVVYVKNMRVLYLMMLVHWDPWFWDALSGDIVMLRIRNICHQV